MLNKVRISAPPGSAVGADLTRVLPQDGIPWYKKRHLLFLNYCAISLALLSAANGYDGSLMNGLQALPQWDDFMGKPTGSWLGFINALQSLSTTIGNPIVAYFANRAGRKRGLLIGYFFILLAALLQGLTPRSSGFVVGRIFAGQPCAWWSGLAPLLITELAYPTHRGSLTALYNCGWYVGSTVAAWTTFATRNYGNDWAWRIPCMLQIAIPLVVLPAVLLVPESPRFLVSVGKCEQARQILAQYHAGGDEHSPLVDFEMAEIERTIRADTDATSQSSWLDLFRTRANWHRSFISITLGVFAQWNGVGVVSYYLALVLKTVGITSVTQQTLISGCLQIWNLLWAVGAAFSVDRLGRRSLFLASSIGMLLSYIVISGLSGSFAITHAATTGVAVVPFLFIYYAFYDIAFTPLLIAYPAEIWPYQLRSRGLALTSVSTNFAVFFNTFVNPIALGAIGWKYYIVYAVILVVITITVYLFYPETKGHSLEEMATIFEAPGAEVSGLEAGVQGLAGKDLNIHHVESVPATESKV